MSNRVPQEPLHPSIIPILDPEYVAFHTEVVQYVPLVHTLPWNPDLRNAVEVWNCAPLDVGNVQDFDLTHVKFRAYAPEGVAPTEGWPVFIFFHGGGWTFGSMTSESYFLTTACIKAECVVVSVDYRLSPEHPYPAAIDDAVEALYWVVKNGKTELNVDTSRIAVGGTSSGAHIAAVLTLKAAEMRPSIPLVFQLLLAPIFDNTLTASHRWEEVPHVPGIGPDAVPWYQHNFLPNDEDRNKWDASPILAPSDLVRHVPKAWIGVMEFDILRPEGVAYGMKLSNEGVEVETVVFKAVPHTIVAMTSKYVRRGRQIASDTATALAKAFGSDVKEEIVD